MCERKRDRKGKRGPGANAIKKIYT